ncbi:MAG: hypothetical protein HBSIN02_22880 [Bacteroidia bacterium]|nr:MAG: hypothetical protein HBSIN02_22880 [Bacteroidia bacterium]
MLRFTISALALCLSVAPALRAQNWSSQTIPTSATLRAIHFIDANNGWAAGYDGVILHTTNGGSNWNSQTSGISTRLVAIRFVDANYGWANTGLKVLRTEDGGSTWNDMTGLDANAAIFRNTIFPISSTVAWSTAQASGQRWFYRYTATSATAVTEETFNLISSSAQLLDLWFVDQDNGWAVGTSGQIWKITSASTGSPSFTNQTNTSVTSSNLRGVYMVDGNNGWAVGDNGTIIKTTNGGTDWSTVTSGISSTLRDVHALDMNNVIVVGDGGVIRRTSNGGTDWTTETSNVSTVLWSIGYPGASPGYIAGGDFSTSQNGVILKTTDALPVQLSAFSASVIGSRVDLRWRTESEVENHGFEIERRQMRGQSSGSAPWIVLGFVVGAGTSSIPRDYSYVDRDLQSGRYAYRIRQIDFSGSSTLSNALEVETATLPTNLQVSSAYPNPFNPTTTFLFTLPEPGRVVVRIYTIFGEELATVVDKYLPAGGEHKAVFDASGLPSGTYIARISAGPNTVMQKLLLLK